MSASETIAIMGGARLQRLLLCTPSADRHGSCARRGPPPRDGLEREDSLADDGRELQDGVDGLPKRDLDLGVDGHLLDGKRWAHDEVVRAVACELLAKRELAVLGVAVEAVVQDARAGSDGVREEPA